MSEIINCKQCGQIFISHRQQYLCPVCSKSEANIFKLVRQYVRNHPGQNIWEVAEGSGVRSDLVLSMVKNGQLILVGETDPMNF